MMSKEELKFLLMVVEGKAFLKKHCIDKYKKIYVIAVCDSKFGSALGFIGPEFDIWNEFV